MKILGVTWGDPTSAFTYSGVPWRLFGEFERQSLLVGRADAKQVRFSDVFRGGLDIARSVRFRRPRRTAIWRYLPENIELLSQRFAAVERHAPDHDVVLQFGVAGIPSGGRLVAHVEIPVEVAASEPLFARSYGFDRLSDRTIDRAVAGERAFLRACSLVWTNSAWTAAKLTSSDCPADKIRMHPPGCGADDPGEIARQWDRCSILFIGKDWTHKGGPELVEAFRAVRARRPDAELVIIGCEPAVSEPGVTVLGYLRKDEPGDAAVLDRELRRATIFCMPSLWESTGIVYMEAALYGLPVIMISGQGREGLFPRDAAHVLKDRAPERLAAAILDLASDPERMRTMGASGRSVVLERYMWPEVADRVAGLAEEALVPAPPSQGPAHLSGPNDRA